MRAGTLNRQVTFQRNTPTRGAGGGDVASWAALGTVWGAVEPIKAREPYQADQRAAYIDTEITIRYRNDWMPTAKDRAIVTIGSRTRTYEIAGPGMEIGREGWKFMAYARDDA